MIRLVLFLSLNFDIKSDTKNFYSTLNIPTTEMFSNCTTIKEEYSNNKERESNE